MITFPDNDARPDYMAGGQFHPFNDADFGGTGKLWTWNQDKGRWEPYLDLAFANLSDKTTADLPAINTPLGTALDLKADVADLGDIADIDFVGGAEIAGALADGDLFAIRDISGTPANKTSLLSRVWDYISAKLASPPAIGGTAANTIQGTTITATTGFVGGTVAGTTGTFNAGTLATPSIRLGASSGIYEVSSNIRVVCGGANHLAVAANFLAVAQAGVFSWATAANAGGAVDAGISRKSGSPGVLRIGNGVADNASGSLELTNLTASGTVTATTSLEGPLGAVAPNTVAGTTGTFNAGTASSNITTGTVVVTGGLGVSGTLNATSITATAGTFTSFQSTTATLGIGYSASSQGAATAGIPVRASTAFNFSGQAWNTTATAATKLNQINLWFLPVSGATTSGRFICRNAVVDAVANTTELFSVTTGGAFDIPGTLAVGGNLTASGTVTIGGGTAITTSGATGALLVAAATPAAAQTALGIVTYKKSSDESLSDSVLGGRTLATDYANISEFSGISLTAGKSYRVDFFIAAYVPTTEGAKVQAKIPVADGGQHYIIRGIVSSSSSATGSWGNGSSSALSPAAPSGGFSLMPLQNSAGYNAIRGISGKFYTGVIDTTANLDIQWAQRVAGANVSILKAGSSITVTEI